MESCLDDSISWLVMHTDLHRKSSYCGMVSERERLQGAGRARLVVRGAFRRVNKSVPKGRQIGE